MKKLFVPILVLTLIVGFSALALGGTEASGTQTLTVDVQKAYSISAPSDPSTITVGPEATKDCGSIGSLGFDTNDASSTPSVEVAVDENGDWLSGLTLTISPQGTGNGSSNSDVDLTTASDSGTIIDGTFTAGESSVTINATFSPISWTEDATAVNRDIKLIYKFTT